MKILKRQEITTQGDGLGFNIKNLENQEQKQKENKKGNFQDSQEQF